MTHTESKKEVEGDTDIELIDAINSGKNELFPELVKKYQKRLYNFGLRICRDSRDAEDLVQDTFINVHKYLGTFRKEAKFKNWMYRIAVSMCSKMRRKSVYAPDRELSLEEFMPGHDDNHNKELPSWADVPLDSLLNRELNETVREAIHSLPEQYKMVIVLRDLEGFSTKEAAKLLDTSVSNVKVMLHRARLYLREELKKYYDSDKS
jgi:RNA polymerase sigma-70 factor (ECF subfamily)